MDKVKCQVCLGTGKEVVFHNTGSDYREHFSSSQACSVCAGSGETSREIADKYERRNGFFDEALKKWIRENHE